MSNDKILSETWQPEGFVLRVERVEKPDFYIEAISGGDAADFAADLVDTLERAPAFMEMERDYTLAGHYIGDVERGRFICGKRGIAPELAKPTHTVCSIGFCQAEQKWYGWSHRAIYGFGIGSKVSRGDCSYAPRDWDDFKTEAARFWTEDDHVDVKARDTVDADGKRVVEVSWVLGQKIPNEALRGTVASTIMYPPEAWGRGEWTAETLDDARQMAVDFAEGVS